ncbi:MAG TPA: cupredoxin domain-containing protein [Acidimicrobiales bacterium]|nr:cupredoxin domain-containing protein [Acidimicrobiales bacterium]
MTALRRLLTVLCVPALVLLTACGPGDDGPTLAGAGEDRTVEITMRDIAFSPDQVDVRAGEKIRFVFTNTGSLTHDAFIGDAAAQEAHEKDMRSGHDHGEGANAITLKPGKQGQLVYTFDRPGQVIIGCHEPGHYTGGMKVTVNVA